MAAITAFTSERGIKQFRGLFTEMFLVTATIDPASCAAQAVVSDTIAVPGLALGDIVLGASTNIDLATVHMFAYVNAANSLTVVHSNNKASGTVDLAEGTYKFIIARP